MIKLCSLLFPLLVFTEVLSTSAAPLSIAEARESVGKTAEITGTVITQTQGGDNTYLSFGDAYPRQSFTVQYNRHRVAHLDQMQNANGRQVVVAGEIAAGVHGPRMIVDDIRQISFLPVDEKSALSKPVDGGVARNLYSLAWKQILQRGEFERIEEQATVFARKETRGADGLLQSISFFDGLTKPDGPGEEGWTAAHDRLLAWRKKYPDSITARLAEAGFLVDYAWEARGSGWADSVSKEGWKNLGTRLEQAKKLAADIPQNQRRPFYYQTMLSLAIGENWDKTKVLQLLRESQVQCPDTAEPYFQVAIHLLPRWHGEEGEWEEFLEKETAGDTPFQRELYARVVWALSVYYTAPFKYSAIFKDSKVKWDKVKAGFEQIVRNTPESSWNLNYFARFAYIAADRETCGSLLERIKGKENMDVWLSWTNFQEIPDWLETPEKLDP